MFAASKTDSVSGAAPDAQFNYVTMLLHGDGTNGAQNNTFLDSGPNTLSITRNGNTTQGSFSPYGSNWSNYFSTSALILPSSSALNAGTGNFTIEAWIFPSSGGYLTGNSGGTLVFAPDCDDGYIRLGRENIAFDIEVNAGVVKNKWQHVAISRSGTTVYVFLDGVLKGTGTSSESYTLSTSHIGMGGTNYIGYASNFRFVVGTALYTSGFTPSTTPLTAVSGTALLTCQSNRFKDNSSNNLTLTPSGTPSVQRFNPFGTSTAYSTSVIGGSGYFDGSGDYLTTPSSSAFAFGTGDFTIEAWVYSLDVSNDTQRGFIQTSATAGGLSTSFTAGVFFVFGTPNGAGTINANVGNTNYASSGGAVKANAWTHIAVTRASGAVKVFVNGAIVASGTGNTSNLTGTYACIGGYYSTAYLYQGYLSDLRIVKGTAVYTAAFTPNTAPLTAVTNTSLLTSYTNGAIFDNSMMNDLETVGNAQISTSVKKYGTGSISFDGSGDYLASPPTPNLTYGTGNFTIEAWVYLTSTGTIRPIVECRSGGGSTAGYAFLVDENNYLNVFSNGFKGTSSSTITGSSWTHVALVRTGTGTNQTTYYINGTASGTITLSGNLTDANTNQTIVGNSLSSGGQFNGYIDDLRITKGYARYTANFTAPTSALSDTGPY